tara:strand:+ start:3036 stop:4202 length:1167 start_codon:yes stop_codon:yes gene_type:complete
MRLISFLIFETPKKDILLWDNISEKIISNALRPYNYISINTREFINIAPFYIFKSIKIFLKNYKKISSCSIGSTKKAGFLLFNPKVLIILKRIKYSLECINELSVILYYKPRLIISNTDNSVCLEFIDAIIHESIPLITIQNGNRWHSPSLEKMKYLEHFFRPKGFHSCFAALSKCDIDMYKNNGWKCKEYEVVGSLNSEATFNKFCKEKVFDICIIAESINKRNTTLRLSKLLRNFLKNKSLKVCVTLKRSPSENGFAEYYEEVNNLFGDFAYLIPRNSSSLGLISSAEVIIGIFSTALRDVFSLGNKIYPINFGPSELNSYMNFLQINLKPSQDEFNNHLEELLEMSKKKYISKYENLFKYLGSFPQDISPTERLGILIERKIKNF